MALREFGAYLIMLRNNAHDSLIHSGKLFQEWLVDTYARVESNRLTWHRDNQDRIRSDLYQNIQRAAANGTIQARELGTKVILPSSFTGGPRYMMREYQDAMAIVRGKLHGLCNIINNMCKVVNNIIYTTCYNVIHIRDYTQCNLYNLLLYIYITCCNIYVITC